MNNLDEIIINILSFSKYSNNLRINKRFNSLVNVVFYNRFFIKHCEYTLIDKVELMINEIDQDTLMKGFIVSAENDPSRNGFELRKILINHANFDHSYKTYYPLSLACKERLSVTVEELLKYDYEYDILKEKLNLLIQDKRHNYGPTIGIIKKSFLNKNSNL
jgi:hypothetical protein